MKLKEIERLLVDHLRESGEIRSAIKSHTDALVKIEKLVWAGVGLAFTTSVGMIANLLVRWGMK